MNAACSAIAYIKKKLIKRRSRKQVSLLNLCPSGKNIDALLLAIKLSSYLASEALN